MFPHKIEIQEHKQTHEYAKAYSDNVIKYKVIDNMKLNISNFGF